MRPVLHIACACCALLFLGVSMTPSALRAQSSATTPSVRVDSLTEVRMRDGSVFYGRVESESADSVILRTGAGIRVAIPVPQIEGRRLVSGRVVRGAFWPEDRNRTRLLFTSTGRALRKGEGYVSAFFLFFPFVAVGVTDHLTLSAGTPVIPGAIGEVFYVAPKLTLRETSTSSYAVGALSFALTDDLEEGTYGVFYGVGTWGNRDNAITAGAGWGYRWGGGNSDVTSSPILLIGGETRTSRRTKLVTENWIFSGDGFAGGILTGAVRLLGERVSADLGLAGAVGSGDVGCCVPVVNVVWSFGR